MESIRIVKTEFLRLSKSIIVSNLFHDKRNLSYYLQDNTIMNSTINVKSVSVQYVRMLVIGVGIVSFFTVHT